MTFYSHPFIASAFQKSDSAFDDLTGSLGDPRPHPTEEALVQLGRALMTELVDVISDTALEDYQTIGRAIRCDRSTATSMDRRRRTPSSRTPPRKPGPAMRRPRPAN